jgi:cell division protein FtsZ
MGVLTVAVVTRPFLFEGKRRSKNADHGIADLSERVDTIISIPNQKLLGLDDDLSVLEAFRRADDVLVQAVKGISDLITQPGVINVDFADVKTIMNSQGRALMGTGYGKGERRALDAVEMAINSPLLDDISIDGAMGILLNFTAGPDVKLKEINDAASLVQQAAHEDANIIFGLLTDPDMGDVVKVTAIATGFDVDRAAMQQVVSTQQAGSRPRSTTLPLSIPQATMGRHSMAPARESAPPRNALRELASQPPAREMGRRDSTEQLVRVSAGARRSMAPEQQALPMSSTPPRAFGPSALHDEATLDIPAYLRRAAAHE